MQRLNLFFNHCVGESKSICSDKRRRGRRHMKRSNSYRAEIMNTLPSFKLKFSLGFITSCYVIFSLSMVQAIDISMIT